ncbi:gamma-glutamylcyclotransferase family protein [Planococcus ruber]|uniref:gamma-glutamylcyclotransferase family protein n=1 Tax=Planococcus ruber TaxID=2027871 RepID=UPI001FF01723|nr:gamma-glutamylcyclotransferase family protein [Planococcus ruber]MCJ1909087.1 gamma-glutamylcyclotransferase [Planococcus ruber]
MLLFVYGTLKQGGKYHAYLEEANLVAEHASAKGALYDTGLGYPALSLAENDEVAGEVYDIPDVLWPALDFLEDCVGEESDLYEKKAIAVQTENGTLEAVVYEAKQKDLLKTKISSGNWEIAYA